MARILVTGGAGFIGSHLVERLLNDGNDVAVLDDFNDYYDPVIKRRNLLGISRSPRFSLLEGSFLDGEVVERVFDEFRPTHVAHLAGYGGVTPSLARPLLYVETNVLGTAMLLERCRNQKNIERFVLASSSTVYGRGAVAPFQEDAPLGEPLSPYGATKQAAEAWTHLYHRTYGLPTACLRFFNVFGSRMRPDLAMMIFARKILTGETLPLFGDGSVRRDFTHITDICDGIVAALTRPEAIGQSINLGHDAPVTIAETIRQLEKALGKKANIDYQAPRAEDMPFTHADISKARKLLGYEPKVSLEEGLKEFAGWLRDAS